MTISYPISAEALLGTFRLSEMVLTLPDNRISSQSGDGTLNSASKGPRLWKGSATFTSRRFADSARLEAYMELLCATDASFMAFDTRKPAPAYDPGGLILSDYTPKISAVSGDTKSLSFELLPPRYLLDVGDLVAFTYSSGTRYALHRLVEQGRADASGNVGPLQVEPPVETGVAVGQAVTLYRPACLAKVIPQSVTPPAKQLTGATAISFKFQQSLSA